MLFRNRKEAGRQLADRLIPHKAPDMVVLGLPRGGVPVAFEVARALDAPLDVLVVRKLGVPSQPELAMGAIGEGGVRFVDESLVRKSGVRPEELRAVEKREHAELTRRAQAFRGNRPQTRLAGRTVIVVDDGIATGSTAWVACQVARQLGAARTILAAPVASPRAVEYLSMAADEVVCLDTPESFYAIGEFYSDFRQTPDSEVVALLHEAQDAADAAHSQHTEPTQHAEGTEHAEGAERVDEEVTIPAGTQRLAGHLTLPENATGMVVFAHGSGSSRHSPRNQFVASALNAAGLGTLLFDLLSSAEESDRANVFDIPLLATRLVEVTNWLREHPATRDLPIGYFGASTGAAAALSAAAEVADSTNVAAVVSRGGRPDLAASDLDLVRAPTLLIVGGHDPVVVDLNLDAARRLHCEKSVHVVPGATHLFEEPGTLEAVADQATRWFTSHLRAKASH
ncbi:phosphoribosyltransferase [Actinopolymorpha sp. NPDC004070]|uniref:phosphoribosyltransferase n=1 Tax=Actinopolymorpha sp. NPDC004070 TaxID=3154548 RepID=UPI0033AA31B2